MTIFGDQKTEGLAKHMKIGSPIRVAIRRKSEGLSEHLDRERQHFESCQ